MIGCGRQGQPCVVGAMEGAELYGFTRVVCPDPPSRSEKRGLERHEERRVVEEKERGGATVSRGPLTQIPVLGARSGVWNDMGSPALWTHWKKRSYGLTKVPAISEGSGDWET